MSAAKPWRVDLVQVTDAVGGIGFFCLETTRRGLRAYADTSPCEGMATVVNLFCGGLPMRQGAKAVVRPADFGSRLWRMAACEAALVSDADMPGARRPRFGLDVPRGFHGVRSGTTVLRSKGGGRRTRR